jgi:hypothetical protein
MSPVKLCSNPSCGRYALRGLCDECRKTYERERSRERRAKARKLRKAKERAEGGTAK